MRMAICAWKTGEQRQADCCRMGAAAVQLTGALGNPRTAEAPSRPILFCCTRRTWTATRAGLAATELRMMLQHTYESMPRPAAACSNDRTCGTTTRKEAAHHDRGEHRHARLPVQPRLHVHVVARHRRRAASRPDCALRSPVRWHYCPGNRLQQHGSRVSTLRLARTRPAE